MEFILMLTHHDVTIPNALDVLEEVKDTGLKHIGCKDIGLNFDQYKELFGRIRKYGFESYLEVVTYSEEEHFRALDLALKIGAENVIGGMPKFANKTVDYLKQKRSGTGFYPYIGKISGHPCILEGSLKEIARNGKEAESSGTSGINLLLYRYAGDQKELLHAVVNRLKVPLIVAGNVANLDQINELKENKIWAFTIGGAILERKFVENGTTREQIQSVLEKL